MSTKYKFLLTEKRKKINLKQTVNVIYLQEYDTDDADDEYESEPECKNNKYKKNTIYLKR